jgi:CHAT domain-containing protein
VLPGEVHLDQEFTAARLRDALDMAYPVLHVASHFVFEPGTESNSFLLLGDGSRLTLLQMKESDLDFRNVDLITLSACDTAVGGGKDANGQEIEGFGALAQKQGAKGVIATLWPVADESTGLLMQNFYRLRESGRLTKAEALRQAQLALIGARGTAETGGGAAGAKSAYAHPYFWAPFILMGNWL